MTMYRRKPETVEAVTFDEFVAYGLKHTQSVVGGMPWSFDYEGYVVTHENNECYLISVGGYTRKFTPKDVIVIESRSRILHVCSRTAFSEMYEEVI